MSLSCFIVAALVKDLHQNQSNEERVSELADRITTLVEKMHCLTFDRIANNSLLIQIHSCAVTLWNVAVAMKTGGHTGAVLNARCKSKMPINMRSFNTMYNVGRVDGKKLYVVSEMGLSLV